MQKRLLALVATVAMVLSMFAGVAFAAELDWTAYDDIISEAEGLVEAEYTVETWADLQTALTENTLDKDNTELVQDDVNAAVAAIRAAIDALEPIPEVYKFLLSTPTVISSGKTVGFQQVQAMIVKKEDSSYLSKDCDVTVSYNLHSDEGEGDEEEEEGQTENLVTQTVSAPNGVLSFYLPTNLPVQNVKLNATVDGVSIEEGIIEVRYNVVTTPADLKYQFTDSQSPTTITGKVTDSKGNPVEGAIVALEASTNPATAAQITNDKGEFGFVVLEWTKAGEFALKVDGYKHKDIDVTAKAAKLTVTPKNAVHSLLEQTFELEGSGFPEGSVITFKHKLQDDLVITAIADEDGKFKTTFAWEPDAAGTYTITAVGGNYEAKATITVTNPGRYNWINKDQLLELDVKENELEFGPNGIHLVTYDGKSTSSNYVYVVYVDGKLALDQREAGAGNVAKVTATKLGTKTIKVIAYELKDNEYAKVYDETFTAKVDGVDVDVDVTTLTVNEKHDITFVIKNAEGTPINNATILFGEKAAIDPAKVNIQNGTYVIKEYKPTIAGEIPVTIKVGGKVMAELKLNVVGQKLYTVSGEDVTLLQGKAQTVRLVVTKDGKAFIPQGFEMQYADGTVVPLTVTPVMVDGAYTAIDVKIAATEPGELILRAKNFGGTECGEFVVDVVAPQLVLIDEEVVNLTDNFKTTVKFKVVDPRDDSAITSNIKLEGSYLTDFEVYDAHGGRLVVFENAATILGAKEHELTIIAKGGQYKEATDDEEKVAIGIVVYDGYVDGLFEVKEATIESDPGMIIIGAQNNLTLTYKDANGNPIVGKKVVAGESDLGKTDENGQVIYPVGVITGTSVTVKANTDVDKVVTEHTIKMGYDMEAPEVTYDAETKDAEATIVISDNVRLARIKINGEEIDFFAGPKYEHVVTLKPGVNKFHIQAQDTNYNVFDEVIEINYVQEGITFTIGKAEYVANGEAKTLEAAPYLKGDHTMIPVRALEAFGAKIAWDGDTKTVTFKLDEKVVKLTVGSTTALVDGDQVAVPVAPEIVNSRTMVPLRFVLQSLGFKVHWAPSGDITITR